MNKDSKMKYMDSGLPFDIDGAPVFKKHLALGLVLFSTRVVAMSSLFIAARSHAVRLRG
jgi:hypothetical protein